MIYKKNILQEPKYPSTEYLNFIVQGAKAQDLPEEYITLLKNKKTEPASYPVPIVQKSKLSYISANCSDCGS